VGGWVGGCLGKKVSLRTTSLRDVVKKEKYLYLYALRGCVRTVRIVPLNNLGCAALSFLITPMFTIFRHFLPPRK
jgi:hypothetical protein